MLSILASIFSHDGMRILGERRETRKETIYRKDSETTVLFVLKCLQVSPAFAHTSQELRISSSPITPSVPFPFILPLSPSVLSP